MSAISPGLRASPGSGYHAALCELLSMKSPQLERLEENWQAISEIIQSFRKEIVRNIPKDDPILARMDLLNPLGRALDENTHSQALAYLLNPHERHGLGDCVLRELLREPALQGAGMPYISMLRQGSRSMVNTEYSFLVRNLKAREKARCDIWIEIDGKRSAGLIIIENKISAGEGRDQLRTYEDKARRWCANRSKTRVLRPILIYLDAKDTPASAPNPNWTSLSYLNIASSMRRGWCQAAPGAGKDWLRLYISTVLKELLGFEHDRIQDISAESLTTYLGIGSE